MIHAHCRCTLQRVRVSCCVDLVYCVDVFLYCVDVFLCCVDVFCSSSQQPAASPSAEAMSSQMPEYRIMLCSNTDGLPYTEQEFKDFFGAGGLHLRHWFSSRPVHIHHRSGPRCRWMFPNVSQPGGMETATVSDCDEEVHHKAEKASVVAKRKLKNAKIAVEACSIVSAVSGNVIMTFEKVLPYAFDPIHFQQKLCLDAAKVISPDGTASMLDSFTFTSERKHVSVVLGAMLPRDIWSSRPRSFLGVTQPGWRRWYKEFRVYAENAFPTGTFKEVPLRELVPLVLQAFVDDERQRLGEDGGALPTHSRGWDGTYHSIVLRTRATLQEVRVWVADWLAANDAVLAFITDVVADDPYCQHFA